MKRVSIVVFAIVCVVFVLSWVLKAGTIDGDNAIQDAFLVTLASFLTLAIMSFMYKDNAYYKFAEHLFVGVSAAYWMCVGFWSTIVGNLVPRLSEGLVLHSDHLRCFPPVPFASQSRLVVTLATGVYCRYLRRVESGSLPALRFYEPDIFHVCFAPG